MYFIVLSSLSQAGPNTVTVPLEPRHVRAPALTYKIPPPTAEAVGTAPALPMNVTQIARVRGHLCRGQRNAVIEGGDALSGGDIRHLEQGMSLAPAYSLTGPLREPACVALTPPFKIIAAPVVFEAAEA